MGGFKDWGGAQSFFLIIISRYNSSVISSWEPQFILAWEPTRCAPLVTYGHCCDNPDSGTDAVDRVGSDVASFIQRRTTDAAHYLKTMSDIQTLISNIEELKLQFSKSIEGLYDYAKTIETQQQTQKQSVETTAQKFIEFFSEELTKEIPGGKLFVARMNFIRLNYGTQCYQSLTPIYSDLVNKPAAGWAQRRQMLLTASAIWRYTFHGRDHKLKAQIESAVECSDCGKFAKRMVERMITENIWKWPISNADQWGGC